jgi:hypothetical protein
MEEYERYRKQLEEMRAPAEAEAAELIAADRYDEAEALVTRVDGSIYGAVAIARLYRRRLEQLVALGVDDGSRARAEAVYRRALRAAHRAYPEPHTGYEARNYDAGRADDHAALVQVLGYDPDAAGTADRA